MKSVLFLIISAHKPQIRLEMNVIANSEVVKVILLSLFRSILFKSVWFQDMKARLKQALQESENLRKANLTATSKEQEIIGQLRESERRLSQQQGDCNQMKQRVQHLQNQISELETVLEKTRADVPST